jgi:hypothetical protein
MHLRISGPVFVAVALCTVPASADVRVTIADGRVSVSATDATVRQILVEWARVGETRIVNAERLSGPPVSLELSNVPEEQALDTLLRSAGGYLAAPRAIESPNTSRFDRIFILPTSGGSRSVGAPALAQSSQAPVFQPPQFAQPDDPEPVQRPAVGSRQPATDPESPPPAFALFPQPRLTSSQQGVPTSTAPPVVGVSTPGMPMPAPPSGRTPGGRLDEQP